MQRTVANGVEPPYFGPEVPHWPATPPPPQVSGATQVPHCKRLPQPSPAGPQPIFSAAQLEATHGEPHTPGVPPPPQVSFVGHVPHSSSPPQPSPAGPQLNPRAMQVVGVQAELPHTPGIPPPPQV